MMARTYQSRGHMQTALQQFAWTEQRRWEQLKGRDSSNAGGLANEPMFCFETAVRQRHPARHLRCTLRTHGISQLLGLTRITRCR